MGRPTRISRCLKGKAQGQVQIQQLPSVYLYNGNINTAFPQKEYGVWTNFHTVDLLEWNDHYQLR